VSGERRGSYLADILVGVRFILRDRLALTLVLTTMLTNLLDAPVFSVLLPVYARQRFGEALDLGLIIAAVGAGALVSSLLFGLIGHRLPRRATFVTSFILVGLPYAALALEPSLELTLATAAFAGLAAGPLNPILGTVAQERVPAELRGRVFGAITAGALMAMPVGVLLGGYLTDTIGVQPMFFGIAACYLAVTLSMLFNPALREMNAPALAPPSEPAMVR
jgi:MFS family permease